MGKKRKKTTPPPPVAETTVAEVIEAAPSQPAVTEEAAAAIVQSVEPAKVEAKPEPTPEPTPVVAEAAPTPIVPEVAPVAESETPPPVSEAMPPTARPRKKVVRKKKRTTKPPPPVTREALDEKIDRLEAKLEEKKEEAAKAAREGFGSKPDDDTSVPPVDLEIHDDFFAAGERPQAPTKESGAYTAIDPRHAQKMSSHAVARRAHLSRYVKWVVGASAGLLLLGFTVQRLRGHSPEEPVRHEVTHAAAAQPAPEQKTEPVVEHKPAPVAANVEVAKTDDKTDDKTTESSANAEAKDAAVVETEQPKGDLPPEKPKNAWQEKQAAKAALERGSNGAAIAAGERSIALDPSDAEAWLVLGAAYQAMGNVGQAKRCFHSCISQGKKGPVSDCRDMLSSL